VRVTAGVTCGGAGRNAGSTAFSTTGAIVNCSPLSNGVDDDARSSVELTMLRDAAPSAFSSLVKLSPSR